MRKHIAYDLDDVMLDFCGGLRHAAYMEYGVELDPFAQWELGEDLNPVFGRSWWEWLRERDWLWPNFPAIAGAIGGVERMRRLGWYVECITSKPPWAEYATWKWLGKWRPPFHRVTIVGPGDKKHHFSDASILVDDKPSNCVEWAMDEARAPGQRQAFLFDRPHNQDAQPRIGVKRVHSHEEVVELCSLASPATLSTAKTQ